MSSTVTVVRAGAGERVDAAGAEHVFALTGAQTGGRLGLEEFRLPAGAVGARAHVHHAHDETFLVLAGELAVATADGEVVLHPGDVAHAPRGAVHGYRNASPDEVRAICLYTPAGYEQYFRDVHAAVAAGHPPDDALLARLRARYGTETV